MRPDQALHFLRLPDSFGEFCAPHDGEEREVGLEHQSDAVAKLIDFLLHGTLREAQKVHIAGLGHQHVIEQLVIVPAQHVLLLEAHRIGAAQPDGFAVQIKHAARDAFHILGEASHAERRYGGVPFDPSDGEGDLRFIEIGKIRRPKSRIFK